MQWLPSRPWFRAPNVTEHGSTPSEPRARLALSLVLVGFVALAVAWLGDPRAASFSDAGGRLATVKTMAEQHSLDPRPRLLGRRRSTASGVHHPILFAVPSRRQLGRGDQPPARRRRPPALAAGRRRAVVLIPVLSVVLAAYAARRLSRWASGGDGWLAFWFVGSAFARAVLRRPTSGSTRRPSPWRFSLSPSRSKAEAGGRSSAGCSPGLAIVMRNDMLITFAALGVAAMLVAATERQRCSPAMASSSSAGGGSLASWQRTRSCGARCCGYSDGVGARRATRPVAGLHLAERLVTRSSPPSGCSPTSTGSPCHRCGPRDRDPADGGRRAGRSARPR